MSDLSAEQDGLRHIRFIPSASRNFGLANYDGVLYDSGVFPEDTVYLDRMWQWDHEKYDRLATQHFGIPRQTLDRSTTPAQIEAFVSDYLGHRVTICKITKTTSQWDGYPYWQIDYLAAPEKSPSELNADLSGKERK